MPTLEHEQILRADGCAIIAGVDEAGRGPLAGPVVAAAAILPADYAHPLLNDSKQLTPKQRDRIYEELKSDPRLHLASALADEAEIDRLNILRATHLAMRRAVEALPVLPDAVLVDGLHVKSLPWRQQALVKGDSLSLSIAAASIIAKVERDRLMERIAAAWPQYEFAAHKGYGTPRHLALLRLHGPCPHHRRSFAPVAQLTLDLFS